MANEYYGRDRGVVAGSAFMNSFMKSYNQSIAMQADIERYKTQQLRYQESRGYAQARLGLSARGVERAERDDLADAETEYAKALDDDEFLRSDPENPMPKNWESRYTKAARKRLSRLQQLSETTITGIGRSGGIKPTPPSITGIGLKEAAGPIGESFMAPDEYGRPPADTGITSIQAGRFRRMRNTVSDPLRLKPKGKTTIVGTSTQPVDQSSLMLRTSTSRPKITGIGKTTAGDLYDMADDVDLDNFAEIQEAIPNIREVLLEDPEGTKKLFSYLKAGRRPDGSVFGTQEAIALLRQLQED